MYLVPIVLIHKSNLNGHSYYDTRGSFIIEFQASERLRFVRSWKGKLSEDVGIFVSVGGILRKSANEILFARRDEVHIIDKGKIRFRRTSKVSIQIGKWNFSGTISPESMQRYESWKNERKQ